jgi:dipeptidyl aminopeptidase/acylaminoacyl peptidase
VESSRRDFEARVSPDGSQVVFASNRSGAIELWLTNKDGGQPQQLTSIGASNMGRPSWSPDGSSVAFCARVGDKPTVSVVKLVDRSVREVSDSGEGPSWSPDSKWVYFARSEGPKFAVWRARVDSPVPELVSNQGGMGPAVSEDGQWIYYVYDLKLWRQPVAGGTPEPLMGGFGSGSFEMRNGWVYYIEYDPGQPGRKRLPVRALNVATRQSKVVAFVDEPIADGFSIDPKGQFAYYTFRTRKEMDLMQVTLPR